MKSTKNRLGPLNYTWAVFLVLLLVSLLKLKIPKFGIRIQRWKKNSKFLWNFFQKMYYFRYFRGPRGILTRTLRSQGVIKSIPMGIGEWKKVRDLGELGMRNSSCHPYQGSTARLPDYWKDTTALVVSFIQLSLLWYSSESLVSNNSDLGRHIVRKLKWMAKSSNSSSQGLLGTSPMLKQETKKVW